MRVPKKSSSVLREGAEVTRKYETIYRQEHSYPVALMCQWAGVPGGPATTSRRAGSRRLLPEDAD